MICRSTWRLLNRRSFLNEMPLGGARLGTGIRGLLPFDTFKTLYTLNCKRIDQNGWKVNDWSIDLTVAGHVLYQVGVQHSHPFTSSKQFLKLVVGHYNGPLFRGVVHNFCPGNPQAENERLSVKRFQVQVLRSQLRLKVQHQHPAWHGAEDSFAGIVDEFRMALQRTHFIEAVPVV